MKPNLRAVCRSNRIWTLMGILAALPLGVCGCPSSGGGGGAGGGDDGGDGGSTEGAILGLQNDVTFSGLQDLTIAYRVPDTASSIEAFHVAPESADDPEAYELLAQGLSPGTSQFTFNAGELPQGSHRIGVRYVTGSGTTEYALSNGVLSIEGQPHPTFYEPAADREVQPGSPVQILIDLGDPEGDVAWRVFYILEDSAPDPNSVADADIALLGNELETGTGNAVSLSWTTTNVALGTYLIGISATDSGSTVSQTALSGDGDQIVTMYGEATVTITEEPSGNDNGSPLAPTVVVTAPAESLAIFGTEEIEVTFTAQTFEGTQDIVEVFTEDTATAETVVRVSGLSTADTSATFSSAALAEGTYRLGVSVDDGVNPVVTAFAPGAVSIIDEPTLEITSPDENMVVRPTDTVSITWTTTVPAEAAEASVTAELESGEGEPIEIPPATFTSAAWTPGDVEPGRYLIEVRLVFVNTTVPDLSATAEGTVRVSSAALTIWMGCLDQDAAPEECGVMGDSPGVIFEGVQFEDNLGSAFAAPGDVNGDGNDDFLMAARYGKPFFTNPDGIGHGEGYLVYGTSTRFSGTVNINTLGSETLPGVAFTGIRTRQGNWETDGLSDVATLPDVDNDGRSELVFGFPNVESRGHNVDPDQDGVFPEEGLGSLERPGQFLRGGIVIVSSTNSILKNPNAGSPVINLDLVGQDFEDTCVRFEPDTEDEEELVLDLFGEDSDTETCFTTAGFPSGGCDDDAVSDSFNDGTNMNWGFVAALSEDYFAAMDGTGCLTLPGYEFHLNPCRVVSADGVTRLMTHYCAGVGPGHCLPEGPNLHGGVWAHLMTALFGWGYSGYYPDERDTNADNDPDSFSEEDLADNRTLEPFGARIIGVGLEDKFGTSIAVSAPASDGNAYIIVSSPERTARGILFQQDEFWQPDWPETGGEITGLERPAGTPATNQESGVAYLFQSRNLWERDSYGRIPPKPHQYIIGEGSHCGEPRRFDGSSVSRIPNIDTTRVAGDSNERIRNIAFIPDFNGDGRNDFAVGSPDSDRVYVAFRRDPGLESDFVLEKLELSVNDPERLSGALITGAMGSEFAASMTSDVDLNGDDVADLVVGAPAAQANTGEVVIIFSSPTLITPAAGIPVDGEGGLIVQGRAAKITGFPNDVGYFGYNVANGGDIDGDGKNDLLIAAPGGSPYYNSDPDEDDTPDTPGLDLVGDGIPVDVGDLTDAGLVYIVWGSNVIEGEVSITELGSASLDGVILVGRRAFDYFGGGDAGDANFGGIVAKRDRGRSFGLSAAGDIDGDGLNDLLIGSVLATPRIDPQSGEGTTHGGEAYLIYGFER